MHQEAVDFVRSVRSYRPPGLVLEIGGRDINGSVRSLFWGDPYLAIDLVDGPGVDLVADGATFVPDVRPSCVVCCEVLEHTSDAETICRHVANMLGAGGIFIVTTAGPGRAPHSGIDGGPLRDGEYYRNIHADDLSAWLEIFASRTVVENLGPADIYAIAQVKP